MWPKPFSPIINPLSDVKHVQGIDIAATVAGKLTEVKTLGFEVIEYYQMWLMDKPVRLSRLEMLDINIGQYRLRQLTEDDEELILGILGILGRITGCGW